MSSFDAYLKKNPEILDNGWDQIYINEAGMDDDGTDIETIHGEQVLAIDVPNKILLVRVKGEGYIGILAVAKDPARLSIPLPVLAPPVRRQAPLPKTTTAC